LCSDSVIEKPNASNQITELVPRKNPRLTPFAFTTYSAGVEVSAGASRSLLQYDS
jgi:hypothetical protein